jgi:phenylpropionate dioxygenase-like ring-hydroxylating dioxygenase large terminal subunit
VPKSARTDRFPVADRYGILWLWLGSADPDFEKIPDLSQMVNLPETARSRGAMVFACGFQLLVDNISDLSHVEYLHATSLGGGAFVQNPPKILCSAEQIRIVQSSEGQKAPPLYDRFLPSPGMPVGFMNEVIWTPPAVLELNLTITPQSLATARSLRSLNFHLITPETSTSCHYWYWLGRDFQTEDTGITAYRHKMMTQVFETEDKPMLEAQQCLLGSADLFEQNPKLLSIDEGSVKIRRAMNKLLAEEANLKSPTNQ